MINKMHIKMINLIIFLNLIFFYKAQTCEELDYTQCENYVYPDDDKTKQCIPNYDSGKCQLKACSELSYSECWLYKPEDKEYGCVHKLGTESCEIKKCSDLDDTQCSDFSSIDEEYQCVSKEIGNGCELKKCSDYKITECNKFYSNNNLKTCTAVNGVCKEILCEELNDNCEQFIPKYENKKCISKNGKCEEVARECEEISADHCYAFFVQDDLKGNIECVKKKDKSGCELKGCYFLTANECKTYKFSDHDYDDYLKMCWPTEEDSEYECEVKSCSDIPKDKCEELNELLPSSSTKKCSPPDDEAKTNCEEKYKSCEEFKYNECRNFYANDDNSYNFRYNKDAKRCIPKTDNTMCEVKQCSQLNANECDRLNYQLDEDNQCIKKLDNSGCEIKTCYELPAGQCNRINTDNFPWKCVEEDNNCVIKAKSCSEMPIKLCEIFEIEKNVFCHLNKKKNKCTIGDNDDDNDDDDENDQNYFLQFSFKTLLSFSLLLL